MRTLAMFRVSPTSTGSSWSFPRVKAGIASCACLNISNSWMVNPRSARTRSPGSNLSIMPQFSVKNLSEVLPPQAVETMKLYPVELCQSKPLRCYDVYMMRTFVLVQVGLMVCQ